MAHMTDAQIAQSKRDWQNLRLLLQINVIFGHPSRYALFADGFKRLEKVDPFPSAPRKEPS